MKRIIFTDLDASLLDHDTYSYEKAREALFVIKKKVPLVICTSKTRPEIEFYRDKLENNDPFVSENGGAIFIPKNYFSFTFDYNDEDEKYFIIKLGTDYSTLIKVLNLIKYKHTLRGFHEMTPHELASITGLTLEQAELAKKREFDEAFTLINEEDSDAVIQEIQAHNLNYTKGGRFWHIMGNNDKGRAVNILSELYKKEYSDIITIAIGDSENDFPMLDNVDKPYLVMKKNGKYASEKYGKSKGVGPEGWNNIILQELSHD